MLCITACLAIAQGGGIEVYCYGLSTYSIGDPISSLTTKKAPISFEFTSFDPVDKQYLTKIIQEDSLALIPNLVCLRISKPSLEVLDFSSLKQLLMLEIEEISVSKVKSHIILPRSLTALRLTSSVSTSFEKLAKTFSKAKKLEEVELNELILKDFVLNPKAMRRLKHLGFYGNTFSASISDWSGLKSLESLKVVRNEGLVISSLTQFPKQLQFLDISGSYVNSIGDKLWGLNDLRKLWATDLEEIGQVYANELHSESLEALTIGGDELSIIEDLSGLSNLKSLSIEAPNLSDLPKGLFELAQLERLKIYSSVTLSERFWAKIAAMPKLQTLEIESSGMTFGQSSYQTIPSIVMKSKSLKSIIAPDASQLPQGIENWKGLESLEIKVTDENREKLKALDQLRPEWGLLMNQLKIHR
mgnify:CR=1 FL=1